MMTTTMTKLMAAALLLSSSAISATAADVKLWSFIDPTGEGARSEALRDVVQSFESASGANVDVNIVEWDQLVPSLMRAAQAGDTPDLVMIYSPNLPALVASGSVAPLDACFARIWSADERADVALMSAAKGSDGAYYGVPYEMRVFGYYYRADLLEKAGVAVPTSFDEMIAAAGKAAANGEAGIGMTFSSGGGSVEAIEWFVPMVIGAGGQILNADGTAHFNSPQAIELLGKLKEAVDTGVLRQDVVLGSTDDVAQLAQSGRAVFAAEGSQEASTFLETATGDMRWGFIPPPGLAAGTSSPAMINGWNLVIPKAAANPDGACDMIKTWTSLDTQLNQAVKAGYLPVRVSLANDAALQTPSVTSVPALLSYINDNPLDFSWPENTDLLNEVLSTMILQVVTGRETAEAAIAAAEDDYDSRR